MIFYLPFHRGRIHFSEMYDMLKNMDPPLGFGSKCPDRLAYKKLIRMNMPLDQEGKVNFTTTLFALIRENLNIKMRSAEEMDQADVELRETVVKIWPLTAREKIEILVPTTRGMLLRTYFFHIPIIFRFSNNGVFSSKYFLPIFFRYWKRKTNRW